jgi:hypothetical protein
MLRSCNTALLSQMDVYSNASMETNNLRINIRSRSNKFCVEQLRGSSGCVGEPLSTVLEFRAR